MDQLKRGANGVASVIKSLTVKRVHEASGITHAGPAIPSDLFRIVRQMTIGTSITSDGRGVLKHHIANRMLHDMSLQALTKIRSVRQREQSAVIGQTKAHCTIFQWNDPTPPAASGQVIRGGIAPTARGIGPIRILLCKFVAIEICYTFKACPNRIGWMRFEPTPMSELTGNGGHLAARIHDPA